MQQEASSALRQRVTLPSVSHTRPATMPSTSTMDNDITDRTVETVSEASPIKENGSKPPVIEPDDVDTIETSLSEPLLPVEREESDEEEAGVPAEIKPIDETSWQITIQVFFPYIIAGLGLVGAGLVLDKVQHWPVFQEVPEIFILVPALLGLKGNLEMTLAARLSTHANLGTMDNTKEQWKLIGGNMALTQAQAIVVGFLASLAAMILDWIPRGKFSIQHAFLLCASSVMTAALASFVLGSIMIVVVLLSRRYGINPDNVATPIAASLGDLTTLALLSGISRLCYATITHHLWVGPTLLVVFLAFTPLWCVISHKNKYTNDVLYSGWSPILGAMVISSLSGLILVFTVMQYAGIAVFQPVINGIGGNLVAVQASRLSTALHMSSTPGKLPATAVKGCPNLLTTFFGSGISARTTRVLMLMVIPGHLIFIYTIRAMQAGHTSFTIIFIVFYMIVAVLQVAVLLYIANWMVHKLWADGKDPDNFSIPYLTALGDLLGIALLALAFHILYLIGDKDADVGD